MLTIKYVDMNTGEELVKSAFTVRADRCEDGRRRVLVYQDIPGSEGDGQDIYCGPGPVKHDGGRLNAAAFLYVMNEQGATVASYKFEESNVE